MNVQLLDVLLYALIVVQLGISCWQLKQLSSSLHWIHQRQPFASKDASMNTVHILIPVYKEAAIIKSCVEYFDKLARYPNMLIHYVTTEKEGENSDTVAALRQLLEHYRFSHLHYPETTGIKAHQLNWAIKRILTDYKSTEYQTTYFGIYDVDSRPEAE